VRQSLLARAGVLPRRARLDDEDVRLEATMGRNHTELESRLLVGPDPESIFNRLAVAELGKCRGLRDASLWGLGVEPLEKRAAPAVLRRTDPILEESVKSSRGNPEERRVDR
jgi:hypothetical protein